MTDVDAAAKRVWDAIAERDGDTITVTRNDVVAIMRDRVETLAVLTWIRAMVHEYERGQR